MKKMTGILLALVLVMSMGVGAFAQTEEGTGSIEEQIARLEEQKAKIEQLQVIEDEKEEIKALKETLKGQYEIIRQKVEALREVRKEARQNKDWDTLRGLLYLKKSHLELVIGRKQNEMDKADVELVMIDAREAGDVQALEIALQDFIVILEEKVAINDLIIENLDSFEY